MFFNKAILNLFTCFKMEWASINEKFNLKNVKGRFYCCWEYTWHNHFGKQFGNFLKSKIHI
jgi:hypothetical protein